MSSEKIVTLFDTTEHARAAERNLIKAGFDEDEISIIDSQHIHKYEEDHKDTSIWKRLFGNDVEDDYAQIYSEAVRTNGAVLSIKVKDDERDTALAILNRHQTVDVSSRLPVGAPPAEGIVSPVTGNSVTKSNFTGNTDAGTSSTGNALTGDLATQKTDRPWLTGDEPKDEIVRLAKEELEVGKRLVKEGTTRIRRYVTEENVSQTVKLREQHAEILRHAVNRPTEGKDIDWSEKEIVIDEFTEKPVITKTAHITEEVSVKKTNTDRDEEVRDTVRQQHIDVERDRADVEKDKPFKK